jgi:5'(3')-deoxyribonucleotidase
VDLDEVLANTMIPVCKIINQRHSTHFNPTSFVDWNAWEIAHISKDEFFRTLDGAWFDWKMIPPTEENLRDKVGRLQEFGSIDIVTGRSPQTVAPANAWLKEQGINFNAFVRTNSGREKTKLDYDVFIDDSPEIMSLLSSTPNKYGIVYTQPWNRDAPSMPKVFRVDRWNQIPSVLRKVKLTQ